MAKQKQNKGTSFIKIFLATLTALIVFWFLLGFLWIIALTVSLASQKTTKPITPKSVLYLRFDRPITEHNVKDINIDIFNLKQNAPLALDDIIKAIKYAKTNKNIAGIFLDLDYSLLSIAQADEIRNALLDFKKSGKFIIAHSDLYLQTPYYLSTVADKIFITPTGSLLWKGLSIQLTYYKSALDKLDIQPIIIRHGKYKSAVEPFMQDTMSNANKEQLSKLLQAFWKQILDTVSNTRKIDIETLNSIADSLSIATDNDALKYKFIDAIKTKLQVYDYIKKSLNLKPSEKIHFVSVKDIIEQITSKSEKNKIAVIFAEGDITPGKKYKIKKITEQYYAQLIRKAASDSNIKAIVLRINSPGGSALASEVIYQELLKAKQNKPIVISMGQYTASGGYYISSPADFIIAEPFTITGSIGVFGLYFNFSKTLSDNLGITINTVKTNPNADAMSLLHKPSYAEKQFIKKQIENIYQTFLEHVAKGRNKSISYIDSIAQGRVWSAQDALNLGLVDQLGTLQDAITKAANIAGIGNKKYQIIALPKKQNFLDILNTELNQQFTAIAENLLHNNNPIYQTWQKIKQRQGIQARMFYDIEIQ